MIKSVHLRSFLATADRKVELGPNVTLITGGNGVGKTSLLESLVWGLWGTRLRPGALELGAEVELELDNGLLERRITTSGERVRLLGKNWQQKTKILPELESLFGANESWSRSLHLTGKTIGNFASGTPSYRWDHMVRLTRAVTYDLAIAAANSEVQHQWHCLHSAQQTLQTRKAAEMAARSRYEAHWSDPPADPAEAQESICLFEEEIVRLEARIAAAGPVIEKTEQEILAFWPQEKRKELEEAYQASLQPLAQARPIRTCQTCGQSLRAEADLGLRQASHNAEMALLSFRDQLGKAVTRLDTYKRTLQDLERAKANCYRQIPYCREALARYERHQESALGYFFRVLEAAIPLAEAKSDLEATEQLLEEKERVVVTLKSAKRKYLESFLRRINERAKVYQTHIGARAIVTLVSDEKGIQLQTEGTGAKSYAQCSGGEQRRIDLCLALAMSEVASGMGNVTRAVPLVIDEAFDTLDEVGMGALLSLACLISRQRQVILVSHVLPDLPLSGDVSHVQLSP